MMSQIHAYQAQRIDPAEPGWAARLAALWQQQGHPTNPELFPLHFIQATFPRIGGHVVRLHDATDTTLGVALLFPCTIQDARRIYTVRLHAPALTKTEAHAVIAPLFAADQLEIYRSSDALVYHPDAAAYGMYQIGAPDASEAPAVTELQRTVWGGAAGALYPPDLHSATFVPGNSLVARVDQQVVGALFGFTRFTAPPGIDPSAAPLGLESQLLAVAPAHRRAGLAATLKRVQAQAALAAGMQYIHWTTDPLQSGNATLNIASLRAIAGAYYPNYYAFTNALNRTPASRLSMLWLPASMHGRAGLEQRTPALSRLNDFPGLVVLNDGPQPIHATAGAPWIALMLPRNWTALQHNEPLLAHDWRRTTDAILSTQLGFRPGSYVITDIADEAGQRYLVAQLFRPELLAG